MNKGRPSQRNMMISEDSFAFLATEARRFEVPKDPLAPSHGQRRRRRRRNSNSGETAAVEIPEKSPRRQKSALVIKCERFQIVF